MQSPNDGFGVWNRWLGKDRYVARKSLTDDEVESMRQFFEAWRLEFSLPFLNKNNRNLDGLTLLAESLPGARFVVVRRNPMLVVQSILESRTIVQGDATRGWGLMSESLPGGQRRLKFSKAFAIRSFVLNNDCKISWAGWMETIGIRFGMKIFAATPSKRRDMLTAIGLAPMRSTILRLMPYLFSVLVRRSRSMLQRSRLAVSD